MKDLNWLLTDLKNSEKESMDEKVAIDIFLNLEEFRNDINAVLAFHGSILREDVIKLLEEHELYRKKEESRAGINETIPGFLERIKTVIQNFKKPK